jgi:hypothetical protein
MRIREKKHLIRNVEWKSSLWRHTHILKDNFKMDLKGRNGRMWPGLIWPGLMWPGLMRPGLMWPGLMWPGLI